MNGHKKLDDYWQYWAVVTVVALVATVLYMPSILLLGWLSFIVFCLGLINLVYRARRR